MQEVINTGHLYLSKQKASLKTIVPTIKTSLLEKSETRMRGETVGKQQTQLMKAVKTTTHYWFPLILTNQSILLFGVKLNVENDEISFSPLCLFK